MAEWEKHLGEKIIIKYLPGARDQMGPNQFQNEFRFDDKTIERLLDSEWWNLPKEWLEANSNVLFSNNEEEFLNLVENAA